MTTAVSNPHAATLGRSREQDDDAGSPHSRAVLRQTQGLIGVVLLAGVACALLVHPVCIMIPAIMGVGLIVAGLTGVCPMALAVARLPWNRSADPERRDGHPATCCIRRG